MIKKIFLLFVITISVLSLTNFPQDIFGEELSPKKQMANGVLPEDVTCKDGLKQMTKNNGDVICVNDSSLQKLFDRNFAVAMPDVPDRSKFAVAGVIVMRSGELDSEIASTNTISGGKGFLGQIDIDATTIDSDLGSPEVDVPVRGVLASNIDLALYAVAGGEIILDSTPDVPYNLKSWQKDSDHHKQVWNIFTSLIPEEYRFVDKFSVYTDVTIPNSAIVNREQSNTPHWELWYDPVKFHTAGEFNSQWATVIMIHEFGHMLTLDPSQTFLRGETECSTITNTYFGCLKDDSILNNFIGIFWLDIESEKDSMTTKELYEKYSDRFVTEYAAGNPSEDIAESWTAFILKDKPQGNSIKEQKILFFYDYENFVDLRNEIRDGASSPFHEQIDAGYISMLYGDIKVVTYEDGTVEYTWPNGSSQINWNNGVVETIIPDEYSKIQHTNGEIEWYMADGRIVLEQVDGVVITEWTDGTVQRVDPDGTTKTVWSNGVTKVVYPDGTSEIW